VVTLRRVEWMLTNESTVRAAVVLMLVYWMCGSETREAWREDGGLETWTGYLCTSRAQREAWLCHPMPSWGAAMARAYGTELLRNAQAAWRSLPPEADRAVLNRGRLRMTEARDTLQRTLTETQEDVRAAKAVRGQQKSEAAREAS
jgi:hypothetical protein